MSIPDTTTFVPCLHNTVTDEIILLNESTAKEKVDELWKTWLKTATNDCQQHRALMDTQLFPKSQNMQKVLTKRSQDWAQLRPEWGLANNAALSLHHGQKQEALILKAEAFYTTTHGKRMKTSHC